MQLKEMMDEICSRWSLPKLNRYCSHGSAPWRTFFIPKIHCRKLAQECCSLSGLMLDFRVDISFVSVQRRTQTEGWSFAKEVGRWQSARNRIRA